MEKERERGKAIKEITFTKISVSWTAGQLSGPTGSPCCTSSQQRAHTHGRQVNKKNNLWWMGLRAGRDTLSEGGYKEASLIAPPFAWQHCLPVTGTAMEPWCRERGCNAAQITLKYKLSMSPNTDKYMRQKITFDL